MMPMLRLSFFLACWYDMGIDMQEHWVPVLIEDIGRSYASFLEDFTECCISWVLIV
jgi:hypothetical protein